MTQFDNLNNRIFEIFLDYWRDFLQTLSSKRCRSVNKRLISYTTCPSRWAEVSVQLNLAQKPKPHPMSRSGSVTWLLFIRLDLLVTVQTGQKSTHSCGDVDEEEEEDEEDPSAVASWNRVPNSSSTISDFYSTSSSVGRKREVASHRNPLLANLC